MSSFRALTALASFLLLTLPIGAADVIIESRPGGINNNNYQELAGNWLDSNQPPTTAKSAAPGLTAQGELGSRKITLKSVPDPNDTKVLGRVRFSPKLTEAGHHHVYITWPRAANATPVNITIKHAKGEEKRQVMQDGWGASGGQNADSWIALGDYDFNPGDDQYVELSVDGAAGAIDARNPAQAYSDSVRFSSEPVPGATTPLAASKPREVVGTATTAQAASPVKASPVAATADTGPLAWMDLASGRTNAASQKKNLLVFFYAPGNSRSDDIEKSTLNDPRVKAAIKTGYVPIKVNMDADRALATQLQVFRAGTINLYDMNGNGLATMNNAPSATDLLQELQKH